MAACCCSASWSSVVRWASARLRACNSANSRAFSMATTAWSANVSSSRTCWSVNGPGRSRCTTRIPIGAPSRSERRADLRADPDGAVNRVAARELLPHGRRVGHVDGAPLGHRPAGDVGRLARAGQVAAGGGLDRGQPLAHRGRGAFEHQAAAVEEADLGVGRPAQAGGARGDGVEHGLQVGRANSLMTRRISAVARSRSCAAARSPRTPAASASSTASRARAAASAASAAPSRSAGRRRWRGGRCESWAAPFGGSTVGGQAHGRAVSPAAASSAAVRTRSAGTCGGRVR